MKSNKNDQVGNFIPLFDEVYFINQRVAGRCVTECLSQTALAIVGGEVKTTQDLEQICIPIFKKHSCEATFLNYHPKHASTPFPAHICVSVNNELVHGIPKKEHSLSPGDLIKVDLGATYQGAVADAAQSSIYLGSSCSDAKVAEQFEMIQVCRQALKNAVKAIKVGSKIGVIGHTIYQTVKKSPFRLITDYGGHGISMDFATNKGIPHSFPFIANKAQINEGVTITPGMTFAIEPLVKKGDNRTWVASDGWTVMVDSSACHEEHTIFITEQGPEIIV